VAVDFCDFEQLESVATTIASTISGAIRRISRRLLVSTACNGLHRRAYKKWQWKSALP
jgi:hypothetical protein